MRWCKGYGHMHHVHVIFMMVLLHLSGLCAACTWRGFWWTWSADSLGDDVVPLHRPRGRNSHLLKVRLAVICCRVHPEIRWEIDEPLRWIGLKHHPRQQNVSLSILRDLLCQPIHVDFSIHVVERSGWWCDRGGLALHGNNCQTEPAVLK